MNAWADILTAEQLEAHYALTASIDPSFAKKERAFYESRTVLQLSLLRHQAWNCNESTQYQLARTYLAMIGA